LPLKTTLNTIGKFGITGAFSIVFLYTPEIFPTSLRYRRVDFLVGITPSCTNLLNKLALWDATKYYFTNRVVNVWNSLPSHIVSSPTLSTFKSRLEKHDFSFYLTEFAV